MCSLHMAGIYDQRMRNPPIYILQNAHSIRPANARFVKFNGFREKQTNFKQYLKPTSADIAATFRVYSILRVCYRQYLKSAV